LKHIAEVGNHTCIATDYAQKLEAENAKLKKDMADTAQLLEKLAAANGDIGALVTSTSGVLTQITKALKEKGYG
jgi:ABC-type transporter Mla subunit MlaD